jgi:nucleotide-binding universal stress UspA family protein
METAMTVDSILCPVDLSPASATVLRAAMALAREEAAHVTVVHVLEPLLVQASALAYTKDALEKTVTSDLDALIRMSAAEAGVPVGQITRQVCFGEPHDAILAEAAARSPDLIVMGTQGFSGVRKMVFGSTAARVLAKSPVPVLTVPPDAIMSATGDTRHPLGLRRIVVAVDFTEGSMAALEHAAALARRWQLSLVLVHAVEQAPVLERWAELVDEHHERRVERARRELQLFAREIEGVTVTVITLSGKPEDVIARLAEQQPDSLLVIGGSHKRSALQGASTAYRLLCQTMRPVLVLPAPRGSGKARGRARDRTPEEAGAAGLRGAPDML